LFQVKLSHPCLIRSDGSAFNSYAAFLDGIGSINGHLVIGIVTMLDAKIEIFDVYIKVGENEFVFDKLPDYAGHFIAIEFYHRVRHFDLLKHDIFILMINFQMLTASFWTAAKLHYYYELLFLLSVQENKSHTTS
jgi:hypothetical protein